MSAVFLKDLSRGRLRNLVPLLSCSTLVAIVAGSFIGKDLFEGSWQLVFRPQWTYQIYLRVISTSNLLMAMRLNTGKPLSEVSQSTLALSRYDYRRQLFLGSSAVVFFSLLSTLWRWLLPQRISVRLLLAEFCQFLCEIKMQFAETFDSFAVFIA